MVNRFLDLKKQILDARGLHAPDDRPLYAYRITAEEFFTLEALLKDSLAHFSKRLHTLHPDLSVIELAAQNFIGFPALFVLYGAEWWRRRYDGSGFVWEPILHDLGMEASGWAPSRRSACVKNGLKEWGLSLRDSVGLRYLGTMALQGGLPMRLLSDAKGALGRLLRCVLKEAVKAQVTSVEVQSWVSSLGHYLPRTYRQNEIYVLLADVITTILSLKTQAGLTQSEGAIDQLDRRIPGWRDRFPLSVEDADAQGLIDQLVKDATSEKKQRHSRLFWVERFVESDGEGSWHLRSSLPLSDVISSDALAQTFDLQVNELPQFLYLTLRAADGELVASLRKLAGQGNYRVERNPWRFFAKQAAAEHVVHLATTDGREWATTVPRGEALDGDLPWIFDAREDPPKLLRQGGGAVATNQVLVALPQGWTTVTADSKDDSSEGAMPPFERRIFRRCENAHFSNGELSCHIRIGHADAREESYEWRGKRLWQLAVSPAMAFLGQPGLYSIDEDGGMHIAPGDANWHPLGAKSHSLVTPLGPTEMWHSTKGEVNGRVRMLVLPPAAQMRLEPSDATSGCIRLVEWGAINLRIDHPNITHTQQRIGNDLVASLQVLDQQSIPEWLIAEVHWPHAPHPARVRLPFPVKGARIFNREGELTPGTLRATSQLIGVRLLLYGGNPTAPPHMRLKLRLAGKPNMVDRVITSPEGSLHAEVRLQDYATEIAHLLANDDQPDAHVEVFAQIGGESYLCLRVAHYACRLDRSDECVFLGSDTNDSITSQASGRFPVAAIRLDSPDDEPFSLTFIQSEESPKGAWDFSPKEREPGAWLIYPPAGSSSSLVFRPTLWMVDGENTDSDGLAKAVGISDPKQREEALDEWVCLLSEDFLEPGWEYVNLIVEQLGHLPLVTLDLWRAFAHSDKAMAALALRYSLFPYAFPDRFAAELPFAWEAVSFDAWTQAISNLHKQCELRFKDAAKVVFESHLTTRLSEITSRRPNLRWAIALACAAIQGEHPQELSFFQNIDGDQINSFLYGGDDSPWQHLLRGHIEDQWPEDFQSCIARARSNRNISHFLCPEPQGYRDSIVNLPLFLAAQAAIGANGEWFNNPMFINALRKHIDFDPDWFEAAYNWSIGRCISVGLINSEFTQ